MSSSSYSQQFSDFEFKSGALMWFSNLDTNSPWGTSFPLSVPAQAKKEVISLETAKPTSSLKTVQQQSFAQNDFVQVSNLHWNQNLFGQTSSSMNKKTSSKLPLAPPVQQELAVNSNGISPLEMSALEEDISQNLYKTELCRSFEETGSCRYGLKCQFAHGRAELRPLTRHPKYKTEVCKTFHTIGTCPYGKRCRFIHIEASGVQQNASVKVTPPLPPSLKNEVKAAPVNKMIEFQNNFTSINGATNNSNWSNNWTDSFTSASPTPTPVNFNQVGKVAISAKNPVEKIAALNSSLESHERRSRLGIFQQICS